MKEEGGQAGVGGLKSSRLYFKTVDSRPSQLKFFTDEMKEVSYLIHHSSPSHI